ncbi:hypothetical protein [Pinibacter soli]|uniref:DUF4843 domain-containing protein n=1 Tax=Pinibacter soli TaxID=3044211 RepID=A0ABT6RFG7_9BACT|nr:hypothetical protein [Pinibacter soli]MDI3321280.1 hypothetical protein [Pinibacter soli]
MNFKISILSTITLLLAIASLSSCHKEDYPKSDPIYDNYYYIGYESPYQYPWNNTKVSVAKTQPDLVKFPVQFHSAFVRNYDAVVKYVVSVYGYTTPAVAGVDYNIVDKNGNKITVADTVYTMTFPQAKNAYDTIYVKLLNNPASGTRTVNIDLIKNVTDQYTVGTFSQAYRRPLEIK